LIVCCVHCYAVTLIIAFVDVNKTYLILSYLILCCYRILYRYSLRFECVCADQLVSYI